MNVDCQWGRSGAARAADVAIVVDVLCFTTCVTIAAERGARLFPFWEAAEEGEKLAALVGAAGVGRRREEGGFSLSPSTMMALKAGDSLVLPSPNGAQTSLAATARDVLAGSLRNAKAVAAAAEQAGENILIAPAGELWPDGSLRVAFEDMIGAGAIISHLRGDLTPEARAAAAAFESAKANLRDEVWACWSGRELRDRGFPQDVEYAAQLNVSGVVPMLMQHRARYRDALPDCELASRRVRYFEDVAA